MGLRLREIGLSVGTAASALRTAVTLAREVGLDWPAAEQLNDEALDLRLYA
jgi:hypothetical protein